MADRALLRLAAMLLFIGLVVYSAAQVLHQSGTNLHQFPLNTLAGAATAASSTYTTSSTAYASSSSWTAVHLGQFVGTAVFLAGLLVLFFALDASGGAPRWVGFFGAVSAGVALALSGVVYAVDGVALKQAVDAWASAPAAEQAARLASAEALRWLEWGTRSYQEITVGLALVLFAIVIVWTARVPRPIGYFMGVNGLASIAQGWVVGTEGFSVTHGVISNISSLATIVWMIWLLIVAWRTKESGQVATAST